MRNYWSCSKFADKIRGIKKPYALGLDEWDTWKKEAKQKHPIRYWLAEKGLDHVQKIVDFPKDTYHSVVYYINNRWITKTHALTSTLEKGKYYDLDTRIIECLFNELVEFVEVELAWHHVMWSKKEIHQAPWWRRLFRFRTWRSPEHGIAHLVWASNLKYDENWMSKDDPRFGKPTPQAEESEEILDLYYWWKERNNRLDPHDASGWTEYCKKNPRSLRVGVSNEGRQALDRCADIEKQYDDNDTEMLIRLIKIRKRLWT